MYCLKSLCRILKPWVLPCKSSGRSSYRVWDNPEELSSYRPSLARPCCQIRVGRRSLSSRALAAPVQRKYFQGAETAGRSVSTYRRPSVCDFCLQGIDPRPCFDIGNVVIERANQCHSKLIRSFLYTHHWPREPSVTGLWLALDSQYLQVLTERYATTGERFLAFELEPRTRERRLIGVLVANKVFRWGADELEEWAHYTISRPERHRMYFTAHCLRSPDLFTKYHAEYLWDIEVVCTAAEVSGQGVATLLLGTALDHAVTARYPLPHIVASNVYLSKVCQRLKLLPEWTMKYSDFVDHAGQRVFFPRRPHLTVTIYTKPFSCALSSAQHCKEPW